MSDKPKGGVEPGERQKVGKRGAIVERMDPNKAAEMLKHMPKPDKVLSEWAPQTAAAVLEKIVEAKSMEFTTVANKLLKSTEPAAIAAIFEKMQDPNVASTIFKEIVPRRAAQVALEASPGQVASLFQHTELNKVTAIFKGFEEIDSKATEKVATEKAARILECIEPTVATQVVNTMHTAYIANVIENMDSKLAAELLVRKPMDGTKGVTIGRAKEIIGAMDEHAVTGVVVEIAKLSPNRAARRMGGIVADAAARIFQDMPDNVAGEVLARMPEEQATEIIGKMNALPDEPANRIVPEMLREVWNIATVEEVSGGPKQSASESHASEKMAAIRIGVGDPEDAADNIVEIVERKGPQAAADLLEYMPSKTVAAVVKHIEEPKLLAAVFRKMEQTKLVEVALVTEPAVMVPAFDKMPAKEVVSILRAMAKENISQLLQKKTREASGLHEKAIGESIGLPGKMAKEASDVSPTVRILEILHSKIASRVIKGLETAEAVSILSEMSPNSAAKIMERLSAYEAVRIVKTAGVENEVVTHLLEEMSPKRAVDLDVSLNMIGDQSAGQGKFHEMAEKAVFIIKYTQYKMFSDIKRTLAVGLGALASTMVSGAIDQAQIFEQQGFRVTPNVADAYAAGFIGSFVVGNLFYRFAQSWEVPKWVPILGGKTIGSSPTAYQLSFSVMWATVGTLIQLGVQPWLSRLGDYLHF